jgi:hypothetical protein
MTDSAPRLLFLENRSITELWSHAARLLAPDIHCELLRFNPAYGGNFPGRTITINRGGQRRASAMEPDLADLVKLLQDTDRSVYLYGASDAMVEEAVLAVLEALEALEFDLVVGEVTSIYERTANWYCRKHGIPFLAPMTARIPADRFFFIDGDALFPLPVPGGRNHAHVTDAVAHAQTNAGRNDLASTPRAIVVMRSLYATLLGWLAGERLHTPSPWRRLVLSYRRYRSRKALAQMAFAQLDDIGPASVVYCMHVQPESTLDTYSPEYSAQGRLIRDLANECQALNRPFFLRLHPRGRDELQRYLAEPGNDSIPILSPEIAMTDLLAARPVIVSVTGTVLIEAAIAGVPTISLGRSYIGTFPGVTMAPLEGLREALASSATHRPSSPEAQAAWFESVNIHSHPGVIAPPEWGSSLSADNIADLAEALRRAVDWTQSRREPRAVRSGQHG